MIYISTFTTLAIQSNLQETQVGLNEWEKIGGSRVRPGGERLLSKAVRRRGYWGTRLILKLRRQNTLR